MGKKGKRSKTQPSQQIPLNFLPDRNKVLPDADSKIPSADVVSDKKVENVHHQVEDAGVMTNGMSLSERPCEYYVEHNDTAELLFDGQSDSEAEKANRRRKKKERQKEKKLAKKMAAKRKESELSIGDFTTTNEDTTGTGATTTQSSPQTKQKNVLISLYRHPLITIEYFLREIPCIFSDIWKRYTSSRSNQSGELRGVQEMLAIVFVLVSMLSLSYLWMTSNDSWSLQIKQSLIWYFYWIFLGILSSVGLGTGLHTFILYLGPFIAKVSLGAQECFSLDFPQPPYPNQITCPPEIEEGHTETPSVFAISAKVLGETLAWGFGTALGELPPYFVARAASIAGASSKNFAGLQEQGGFLRAVQNKMRDFVMKVGFWGILLCASIPNPLFDLAGITCGHFQVPFTVFFGATAIGKTIVKSQLQMIFVILAFNEKSLEKVLMYVETIPRIGPPFCKVFNDFMDYQRATLHNKDTSQSGGILRILTEIIVLVMVLYFVGSIITGMAQSYQQRVNRRNRKRERKASKSKKKLRAQT